MNSDIEKELKKKGISVGDRISIEHENSRIEGTLMPKSAGAEDTLILKLDSGYNVGVKFSTKIKKLKEEKLSPTKKLRLEKFKSVPGLPNILIINTGGTIASRVDYKTGGVTALESAEEIAAFAPDIAKNANIKFVEFLKIDSSDVHPYHWVKLAEKIASSIQGEMPDGIIVTHGTDTMHYTSAALSFMLQKLPIPVLLVGCERSSDRGSSDASMNLTCAVNFILKSEFAGVGVCMHGSSNDDFCYIFDPLHLKKMHTSRRNTFQNLDVLPYAKVYWNGTVEKLREFDKKDKKRKLDLTARFEKNIALIKAFPGMDNRYIEFLKSFRGVVIEGFAFGHMGVNKIDEFTTDRNILEIFSELTKTTLVVMSTQCSYGVVDMNVYSIGRQLQQAGVIAANMTSETAYVKLGWVLGHTKDMEEAK